MKNKKHIDELFKERFQNLEVSPPARVWDNIEARLNQKKQDRKVIPLWWRVAGVAALLALLFTVGNAIFNVKDSLVLVNEETDQPQDETIKQPLLKIKTKDKAPETTKNIAVEHPTLNTTKDKVEKTQQQLSTFKANEAISKMVREESNVNEAVSSNKERFVNPSEQTSNAVANTIGDKREKPSSVSDYNTQQSSNLKESSANTIKEGVASTNVNTIKESSKTPINTQSTKPDKALIVQPVDTSKMKTVIANEEVNVIDTENTNEVINPVTTSIFDAIQEQEKIKHEEAIAQLKPKVDNRWEVAPNFAPVYYNSLSEGSSIDASFSDNSKSADVNFSYGVGVSYAISERLSIRSGISTVDVSYSTGGLELGEGPVSSALKNVDYNRSQIVTIPLDRGTFAAQNSGGGLDNVSLKSTNGDVFVNQNINYYEVPLELKYALFNSKLGVSLIGGVSTFFLGDNEVSVSAGSFNETLGEANNLTNVSFSTNVGLGFDYKFSKKFKFNVEPMFKYQLNPYTDSSVSYQPYILGVYTGFSFKF
jgi:hypothetical protein